MLEKALGKKFGDAKNPLLVAVRSGAALDAGHDGHGSQPRPERRPSSAWPSATGNERFAYDSYRRLINMFGDTVMGVDHQHFEHDFDEIKKKYNAKLDTDVPTEGLKELCDATRRSTRSTSARTSRRTRSSSSKRSIEAVFKSWMGDRAITYRELNDIRGLRGTAVNVQSMVFGNMGDDCGTGVAFTRDPSTGENMFYGEFLVNAQGEDVVAGIRTPQPVAEMAKWNKQV